MAKAKQAVPTKSRRPVQKGDGASELSYMLDTLEVLADTKSKLSKKLSVAEQAYTEQAERIRIRLKEMKLVGVDGKHIRVSPDEKATVAIEDYEAFTKHIAKTGNFSLLHKRISQKEALDIIDAGDTIPGLYVMKLPYLKVSQINRGKK